MTRPTLRRIALRSADASDAKKIHGVFGHPDTYLQATRSWIAG